MEKSTTPDVPLAFKNDSQSTAKQECTQHKVETEGQMHQGEKQGSKKDTELLLVFYMKQGFYTFLNHTSGKKLLDKCGKYINIGTVQGAADKVAFDPDTGQGQHKLCQKNHQTDDHSGGDGFFQIGAPSGDIGD